MLTYITNVSIIVQFLIALLGLGVAIDYSLIVVSRWREERAHGRSGDEAVQKAYAASAKSPEAWAEFRAEWVDIAEDEYQRKAREAAA